MLASIPSNQTRVLVADDDPVMLRVLARWLEGEGYVVATAVDGDDARRAIRDCPPHCVITDWEMPGCSGFELCKWVRQQQFPNYVYMLCVTGNEAENSLVAALDAGADDFLRKPVNWTELRVRMKSAKRILGLEQRLTQLANLDALTGLMAQRTFRQHLEAEWERASVYHSPLSLAMIDVDFFKRVNDTYGHAAGDEVLRTVAGVLKNNCRSNDLICRYGGEEFAAMLPATSEAQAESWANRIRQLLEATTVTIDGREISVTASFGVAQKQANTASIAALVDNADQALLVAKRSGRNRVIRHQSVDDPAVQPSGNSAAIMQQTAASEVMIPVVSKLNNDVTLGFAADAFQQFHINSAPVVDNEGRLCGMISEREVLAAMTWPQWRDTPLTEVMGSTVVSFEDNTPVSVIYDFLCRVAVRSVIIVSEGRPVGLISRDAVVRLFQNAQSEAALPEPAGVESSPEQRHSRLRDTAEDIVQTSTSLVQALQRGEEDPLPCAILSATRMQSLISEMLGYSRDFQHAGASSTSGRDITQHGLAGLLDLTEAEDNT